MVFEVDSIYLQIIEPSKEVAFQLLESGDQHFLTKKLGLDMLRQLSLHHDYVLLLVQNGYYLEALRYARKNKVKRMNLDVITNYDPMLSILFSSDHSSSRFAHNMHVLGGRSDVGW